MAHKALNCLINCKVDSKVIKPSIGKPNMLSKLINSIKYRFRYYIRL